MPMSFSLFTFDFLGALRRAKHEGRLAASSTGIETPDDRDDLSREPKRWADKIKFWGFEGTPSV